MKSDDFGERKELNQQLDQSKVKLLNGIRIGKAESVLRLKKLNGFLNKRSLP